MRGHRSCSRAQANTPGARAAPHDHRMAKPVTTAAVRSGQVLHSVRLGNLLNFFEASGLSTNRLAKFAPSTGSLINVLSAKSPSSVRLAPHAASFPIRCGGTRRRGVCAVSLTSPHLRLHLSRASFCYRRGHGPPSGAAALPSTHGFVIAGGVLPTFLAHTEPGYAFVAARVHELILAPLGAAGELRYTGSQAAGTLRARTCLCKLLPSAWNLSAKVLLASAEESCSTAPLIVATMSSNHGCPWSLFLMGTRRLRRDPAVANTSLRLQQLGLRLDSDDSVLDEWSWWLSDVMFDGHGSILPAPEHLLFYSVACWCVKMLLKAPPKELKPIVATSLRDALRACGLCRTRVFNVKRDTVISIHIHEWAAVLVVAPLACRRCLPSRMNNCLLARSPISAVLDVIDTLSKLTSAAYFYSRVDIDGGTACMSRYDSATLKTQADGFMLAVRRPCLRPDCDAFLSNMDVPNTHRFHEMMCRTIEALGHIRDSLKLPLKGFHQTLQRSTVRCNGQVDAVRSMWRYLEQ